MKRFITLLLILSLVFTPHPQPAHGMMLQCVVAVVVIVIGGIAIRAILHWCDKLLPPVPPPTPTNVPPVFTNSVTNVFPAFVMPMACTTTNRFLEAQFQDGIGSRWQTQYRICLSLTSTGTVAVASDASGNALATNYSGVAPYSGDAWVLHDFTGLLPAISNQPPMRFYRLVSVP